MAAQPEISGPFSEVAGPPSATPWPTAIVLPLHRTDHARHLVQKTSGRRLGPATGLLLGLAISLVLWAGLGALAWNALHH